MIALAIGGILILSARALLARLTDTTSRIVESAAVHDEDANAERLLRAIVLRVEVGSINETSFAGSDSEVRFNSWCDTPSGWLERCAIQLRASTLNDSSRITLRVNSNPDIVVHQGERSEGFLYLNSTLTGGEWQPFWTSLITLPVAIGVVIDGDTLILGIGERG
jgi:hypothetical protein